MTLLARDGATSARLPQQVDGLPPDATHLAVAIGGNDALRNFDLLSTPVTSTAAAFDLFRERLDMFAASYHAALDALLDLDRPLAVCTIYNGDLPDPEEARRARTALALFNDVIINAALVRRCALVELRLICTSRADYANPIEPSGPGGEKIARALARVCGALREAEPAAYAPHGATV